MMAFLDIISYPAVDGLLDKFLAQGNVMAILAVLGVKGKNERHIEFSGFGGGNLAEQKRMVAMNHIQFK
jgi:hypothetical protein